ncbi:MAG TPA: sigma-70 family RNA polymerase sigma factor [Bacteroidia bacterium]|nr:sigma-70 family RNA polymerase sigma factor [Bacteroidia bacterium]
MSESNDNEVNKMVDHLFRHESGKMVAVLTRVFGFSNIEQAEDIVQDTIIRALESWKFGKLPDNPQAWLYRTAKNKAIDIIRREKVKHKIVNDIAPLLKSEYTLGFKMNEMFTENEIRDSELRMMFACCHPSISHEAQVSLILKTLCGLSVKEIVNAFLTNEETIQKRLYRTKEKIKTDHISLDYPGADAMQARTDAVLKALYLLFNEGYNSSHPQKLIREDLCEEAMRLAILLTENPKTNYPHANALLALMCYHASRFAARLDDKGFIVLLQDQNRNQWNKFLINKGNEYLNKASEGETIHDYHIEAAIASAHANAKSYEETNWDIILQMYNALLSRTQNPVVQINRCLVLGEVEGHEKAISELEEIKGFTENCYYNTSLGEMWMRLNKREKAKSYFQKALTLTSSNAEIELIRRKLLACN